MKKSVKIIIIIIIIILLALSVIKLTGFSIYSVGTGANSCVDTDFGVEFWEKGSVSGIYTFLNSEDFFEEDYCKNENTLVEYYCFSDEENSFKKSKNFKCPSGCEEGRCLGEEIELETPGDVGFWGKLKSWCGC